MQDGEIIYPPDSAEEIKVQDFYTSPSHGFESVMEVNESIEDEESE